MGLFSTIKQTYYNYKLKKAIGFVDNKSYDEAEAIFIDLITSHAEAVTQLAKMYLLQATNQSDVLSFYQKALNCESNLLRGVSNSISFNDTKNNILNKIYQHFKDNISENNYKKAIEFSDVLIQYKKDNNLIKEHYQCLFKLADSLSVSQSKEAEAILIQIYNESKGRTFLSEVISSSKEQLFSRSKEYSSSGNYDSSNFLCLIILEDKAEAKKLLIENNIVNINIVKKLEKDVSKLLDIIKSLEDKNFAVKCLERLLNDLPSAKIIYGQYIIEISNSFISNRNFNDAIILLNKALANSDDCEFIEQLIIIAKQFIVEKDYNSAILLLNNLIAKHPDAEPLLSKCYVELSATETANDSKKDLLLKAFNFKTEHSNLFNHKLYDEVFIRIISDLIEVSYKYAEYTYYTDAYFLLDNVFVYEPLSINTFIKVKVLEITGISNIDKQILLYKETIQAIKQKIGGLHGIENIQLDILYIQLINTSLKKHSHLDLDSAIHGLLEIKKEVSKNIIISAKLEKAINKLDYEIADRYLKKGEQLEIQNLFEDALYCFEIIIDQYSVVSGIYNQALIRKYIISFKNNSIHKIKDYNNLVIKFLESQKRSKLVIDLAYRFSINLIKNGNYDIAKNIIETYLPSNSNSVIVLKEMCFNEEIRLSKIILSELNLKIRNINADSLAIDEAKKILSDLDSIEKKCSVLNDVEHKVTGISQNLIEYIIFKSFQEEKYSDCFTFIKNHKPNYLYNDILFRNIAIASLGIISTGGMNKTNYKELISIWLTAIYNDRLFIHSLNYTSWDDNFTFSLNNSLGNLLEQDVESIPENVNYDETDESNISIGDVQKSLLETVENAISKDSYNEDLKDISLAFLEDEKQAITSLYRLELDSEIIGCTPYFSQQKNEVHTKIKHSLINELGFLGVNKESVLKVGLLFSIEGGEFKDYSDSIILKNKATLVVKNKSNSQIKLIFTNSNVKKIKKYDELFTSLCNELRDIFKKLITDEESFEDIISNYLIVCFALKDTNLDYMVSNFANKICVSKLNEESIKKHKGLQILADVHDVIKDNNKLNENLHAVLNSAVIEIITEGKKSLKEVFYKIIDKSAIDFEKGIIEILTDNVEFLVLSGKKSELTAFTSYFNPKTSLKSSINRILLKANETQVKLDLSKIIDGLNSHSITEQEGLRRTFELYKTNKNNSHVCDNLVILCGNVIHSNVMTKTSSTNQIISILDQLNNNKSTVFIHSAILLANQRLEILDSLPYGVKSLITIGFGYNQTLTPEGELLKKGLNYLERLSSY